MVLSDANCAVLSDPNPVVPSDPATQLLCGCGWQQDKNAVNQFISLFIHAHSHQLSINNQNVQPSPWSCSIVISTTTGGFLKWWYPQIIHFNRTFHYIFHYKPSSYWGTTIYGNPHFNYKISTCPTTFNQAEICCAVPPFFFGALSPVPERVATIDAWKFEGVLRDPGWDRDCQGPSSHVKIIACYKWDKSGYVPRIYISQIIIIH